MLSPQPGDGWKGLDSLQVLFVAGEIVNAKAQVNNDRGKSGVRAGPAPLKTAIFKVAGQGRERGTPKKRSPVPLQSREGAWPRVFAKRSFPSWTGAGPTCSGLNSPSGTQPLLHHEGERVVDHGPGLAHPRWVH